tara:strand:+ start:2624 stop:2773 length:150 start_codon:yes stop_codon:yes gene_type:complete
MKTLEVIFNIILNYKITKRRFNVMCQILFAPTILAKEKLGWTAKKDFIY